MCFMWLIRFNPTNTYSAYHEISSPPPIYYSHIYSHLSYGLTAWGSMISKGKENELFMLQKQCLCYVCKLGQSVPLTDENLRHQLVKFPDMIRIELCKFGHKITQDDIPTAMKSIMDKRGGKKQHDYNTQNKNTPNVQSHSTTQFNQSYLCKSIVEYNKSPQSIRDKPQNFFAINLKSTTWKKLNGTSIA